MFRKKQTPEPQVRRVKPQQKANVFSYYANRSTTDTPQSRRALQSSTVPNNKLRFSSVWRVWLSFAPSIVAGIVLVGCLGYISTLSSEVKLQVVGGENSSLAANAAQYRLGVQNILQESLANKSKLLIDTDALAQRIAAEYPQLGEVLVVLPLIGRRPVVQVEPAAPSLILGTMGGGFVLDEHGRVIAKAADIESSIRDGLPLLQDESGLSLESGRYALPRESVKFVRDVAAQLASKHYTVQSMVLPVVANEMHVRLKDAAYYIKFDLRGQSRVQAGTFIATEKKLAGDNIMPREYIDVRVPGKVYYK